MKLSRANETLDDLIRHPTATADSVVPAWLARRRAHAVDRVGALSVPSTRDEDWRFTDISPLTHVSWQPVRDIEPAQAAEMRPFFLPETAARLVFVDGHYMPALSFNDSGLVVESLAGALHKHGADVEAHLGRHAEVEEQLFSALNMAFLRDGALVMAPATAALAAPVHLLFVATGRQTVSHPRCLIVAGAGSSMSIVEDHVALKSGAYFSNAVAEVALAQDARLDHVRIQRDDTEAFHIASCAVSLGRRSHYRSTSIALGGRISRYNLNVMLDDEGAQCAIDGLAIIGGRQLADTHTVIDHAHPNCISRQLHKCIADGTSRAVFNGKIMVRAGAQQTDSAQSSRNLLLSGKARIDTKPQLEIFADAVKCAHGATVGQLDEEQVFYLQSRGLSEADARNLLTYAFGAEVIRRIAIPSLKRRLEETVLAAAHTGHD